MARGTCGCRPWPVDPDCCRDWPDETASEENRARAQRALSIASGRLWRLTAGRYGLCEEVIRPCKSPSSYGPYGGAPADPYAGLAPILACRCGGVCTCQAACRTPLPGPVAEVLAVKVDGVELPATAYTVTADDQLVRVDGGPCWPDVQNGALPDTEPGTFSVRYLRGVDPADDYDAVRAVSVLACELYRNLCGQKCRIGGRVRSIQREGVSYDILDEWPRRGTGLDEVDDWLSLVNPYEHRTLPAVYTPDLPQHHFHGRDCP